jgi:biopolymer transport protein ExbB
MNLPFEQAFAQCEPWSYVLLGFATLTVALLLERFLVLFFSYNLHLPVFIEILGRLWREDQLDRAEKLALALPRRSPFAQLARVGLAHATSRPDRALAALDGIEADGLAFFRRRLNRFSLIAALAAAVGAAGSLHLGGFGALPADVPRFAGFAVPVLPFAAGSLLAALLLTAHFILSLRARVMGARLALLKAAFLDLRESHPVRTLGEKK